MSADGRLTEERRGEMALAILEAMVSRQGIPGKRKLGQNIKDMSEVTGLSVEELKRLYMSFVPKIYGDLFDFEDVTITAS